MAKQTTKLAALLPGRPAVVDYALDTSLRADAYQVVARVSVTGANGYQSREESTVRIVPRQPPHRFPVLMWGVGSPEGVLKEMGRLKEIGVNHVLGLGADDEKIWEAGRPTVAAKPETVAQTKHLLDEGLANDMTIVASLSPGRFLSREARVPARRSPGPAAKDETARRLRPDPTGQGLLLQRGGVGRSDLRPLPGLRRGHASHRGPRSCRRLLPPARSGSLPQDVRD